MLSKANIQPKTKWSMVYENGNFAHSRAIATIFENDPNGVFVLNHISSDEGMHFFLPLVRH